MLESITTYHIVTCCSATVQLTVRKEGSASIITTTAITYSFKVFAHAESVDEPHPSYILKPAVSFWTQTSAHLPL